MRSFYITAAVLALAILGAGFWWMNRTDDLAAAAEIVVPELGPLAPLGQAAFAENCASCHGADAGGTEAGPPLVHRIYEPSHHADLAFLLAARNGVRAHHWRFGDMPPVEGVPERQVEQIVAFVREVQRANGIR